MIRRLLYSMTVHGLLIAGFWWVARAPVAPIDPLAGAMTVSLTTEAGASAEPPAVSHPAPSPAALRPVSAPSSEPLVQDAPTPAASTEMTAAPPAVETATADGETVEARGAGATEDNAARLAAQAPADNDAGWDAFYAAVRAAIEQAKRYPPSARKMGQEDRVVISFLVAADGRVGDLRVVAPSHFPILNRAAVETIQRVRKFPSPPPDAPPPGVRVQVPLVFALNSGEAVTH